MMNKIQPGGSYLPEVTTCAKCWRVLAEVPPGVCLKISGNKVCNFSFII